MFLRGRCAKCASTGFRIGHASFGALDSTQQAVSTLLRSYLNHPDVDRQELRGLIRALSVPMRSVHVKALKAAYQQFSATNDLPRLLESLRSLPLAESPTPASGREPARSLTRDDLHLVCFDFVWS